MDIIIYCVFYSYIDKVIFANKEKKSPSQVINDFRQSEF